MTSTFLTDRQRFEELVVSLLKQDSNGSFGKLHMVRIQPMLEDAIVWEHLLPKAMAITERILSTRLGPDDACLRLEDGQYLLLFPRLTEAEGHIRAMAISHEIKTHLVGNETSELDIIAQTVPLAQIKTAYGETMIERMNTAARLSEQPKGLKLSVEYQPVWEGARQAVIGNRARVRRDFGENVLYEAATMFAGDHDPLAVNINEALIKGAISYPGDCGPLFLPQAINEHVFKMHGGFEALASKALHRELPDVPSRVIFELAGAFPQCTRTIQRQTITMLHGLGCRIAVRMMPDRETAKFLRDSGVDFVCVNLARVMTAGLTGGTLSAMMTMVAHELDGLGYRLCLWNATTPDLVKRGKSLGYHLISGQPIGPTQPLPSHQRKMSADLIYA